jgi:hypothetical protein
LGRCRCRRPERAKHPDQEPAFDDAFAGGEARFDVMLRLTNPNARELAVDAVDASVTIDDVPVGTATLREPLRLPANGFATATLEARA